MIPEIKNVQEYNKLLNIRDSYLVVLLYNPEEIESSVALTSFNQLHKKYEDHFSFLKMQVPPEADRTSVTPPAVLVIQNGMNLYADQSPLKMKALETQLNHILDKSGILDLQHIPTKSQRIKRKWQEKWWVAWLIIIGGALWIIIKFFIEQESKSEKKRN